VLTKKIIVVTGGAGLLGRIFCIEIAKRGGLVIVADLDSGAADRVAEEIKDAGGLAEAGSVDITETVSVENLIATLDASHGRIDAVVNNAYPRNRTWGRELESVTYESFCENVNLHLGGYFLVAQKFASYFKVHRSGNIINMASVYGVIAPRLEIYADTPMTMPVEYAAIKSSIIQLTRYFAQYFKAYGVRCNALSPGGIFDRQPEAFLERYNSHCGTKGMLDAQDVAGTLLYLLSDASRYMTGQNLIVDDGFCL
jgi:NAD(P)-dependent dehydrogenase (short-subunit alcohol dehydrogenase family)